MKLFVALAAAVVLAQGAQAAQQKTVKAGQKKTVAAKSMKKKKAAASKSSATQSASALEIASAVNAPAAAPAATSTAKASTTVGSPLSNIGADWYTYAESNIRETNTDGGVVDTSGSFVGLNYKLADGGKLYLRQQYGFEVPGTGAGDKEVESMKMRADDIYLRYQNMKLAQLGNDTNVGIRTTLTLPTGEKSRTSAGDAHNGKASVRGYLTGTMNKTFSWLYLAQVGYNNMANKGTFNKDRNLIAGTTAYNFSQVAELSADLGGVVTLSNSIGQKAGWKNETEDVGVEQTNKINLTTYLQKEIGPVYMAIGVTQDQDIMSDAKKEDKFSLDKIYDDESTAYCLELQLSI